MTDPTQRNPASARLLQSPDGKQKAVELVIETPLTDTKALQVLAVAMLKGALHAAFAVEMMTPEQIEQAAAQFQTDAKKVTVSPGPSEN